MLWVREPNKVSLTKVNAIFPAVGSYDQPLYVVGDPPVVGRATNHRFVADCGFAS